jgi:hypothetical protein
VWTLKVLGRRISDRETQTSCEGASESRGSLNKYHNVQTVGCHIEPGQVSVPLAYFDGRRRREEMLENVDGDQNRVIDISARDKRASIGYKSNNFVMGGQECQGPFEPINGSSALIK